VVVLTTFDHDEYVYAALRAGTSGFLLKDIEPADLLREGGSDSLDGSIALALPTTTSALVAAGLATTRRAWLRRRPGSSCR
jgi:DNA-binding NarL/FixJ family response regulator